MIERVKLRQVALFDRAHAVRGGTLYEKVDLGQVSFEPSDQVDLPACDGEIGAMAFRWNSNLARFGSDRLQRFQRGGKPSSLPRERESDGPRRYRSSSGDDGHSPSNARPLQHHVNLILACKTI